MFNLLSVYRSVVFSILILSVPFGIVAQVIQTFNYSGSVQTFTVPPCVTSLTLTAKGAQGGTNAGGIAGGLGGSAYGVLTVSPGDLLYIYVGGSNGYNGGGSSGVSSCTGAIAGTGGGATDIRLNGTALANRVIVGGGGGGAGGNRVVGCGRGNGGGGGGGYYGGGGGAAWPSTTGTLPVGGSQTAGGAGGFSSYTILSPANNGSVGTIGQGGNGGSEVASNQAGSITALTGGVGGGLNGGPGQFVLVGGGGEGGSGGNFTGQSGAGGSSYNGNLSNAFTNSGDNMGHGFASLSYMSGLGSMSVSTSASALCFGSALTLSASGQMSYTWSTGSNASSIVVSPTISTSYTVTATNSLNCVFQGVQQVIVDGSNPVIYLNTPSITTCAGQTVALTASGASGYTWTGGVQNGMAFTPTSTAGYTVTGSNACGTATASTIVTVNPLPAIVTAMSASHVCFSSPAVLSASGAASYTWSHGVMNGVPFYPNSSNTYTVIGSSAQGCTAAATVSLPVFSFTGTTVFGVPQNTVICLGSTLTLQAGGASNYTWTPGSSAPAITVSPASSTVYTLTGINGDGCFSSTEINVVIDTHPIITAISSPTAICQGGAVMFSATGATTFTWSGGFTNGQFFVPQGNSTYTVFGSNACGTASSVASVIVNPIPTVGIVLSSATVCSGNPVILNGTGANTYQWSGGVNDGQAFYPIVTANYSVTGTNAFGCTAQTASTVIVYDTPTITPVAALPAICAGNSNTLTAGSSLNYTWLPGNFNTGMIIISPGATTTYTLVQSNTWCSHQQTLAVIVNPLPILSPAAADSVICAGESTQLTVTGGSIYTWQPLNQTGQNITVTPTGTTIYTVTGSDNFCSNTSTLLVTVHPNPSMTATASQSMICAGQSVSLAATGANNFTWFPGGQNTASIVANPTITTMYLVKGVDVNGCASAIQIGILVNSKPNVSIIPGSTIACPGGAITLTATGAGTFSWNTGATGAVISVIPVNTTTFSVVGYGAGNCSDTSAIAVSVFNPTVNITGPASVCAGQPVVLAASGANNYTWSTNSLSPTITVFPTVSTVYQLNASSTNHTLTCQSTHTISVLVLQPPGVMITSTKTEICRGEVATLNASGANSYVWNNGSTTSSIKVSPVVSMGFSVTGTGSNGCTATSTVQLFVLSCTGVEVEEKNSTIKIWPNPSTGEFNVSSLAGIHLDLYNNIGQLISQIKLKQDNHYQTNIKGLAQGVYFLIYSTGSGESIARKIIINGP